MLCPLNKVASSSMMRLMLTLQGIDHKNIESPHGYRKRFNPQVSCHLEFTKSKRPKIGKRRTGEKTFCMFSLSPCQVSTTAIRPKTVKKQLKTFFCRLLHRKINGLFEEERQFRERKDGDTKGDYNFFAWSICALKPKNVFHVWLPRIFIENGPIKRGKWCPISISVHFRQLSEFSKVKKREQSEYEHAYLVTRKQINPNFWGCHLPLIKQRGKSWRFFPGQTFFFQLAILKLD